MMIEQLCYSCTSFNHTWPLSIIYGRSENVRTIAVASEATASPKGDAFNPMQCLFAGEKPTFEITNVYPAYA
jgi:hypothetical protein